MRREIAPLIIVLSVLAACAHTQSAENNATSNTRGGATAGVAQPSADACHASQFRYLVGKKRSEMPAKPADANWRVACTSCAVTLDFSPTRMNIFFDEKTDVIKEVKCG
jgi:hypothetical protein